MFSLSEDKFIVSVRLINTFTYQLWISLWVNPSEREMTEDLYQTAIERYELKL
jgi:hypothetical protein